MYFLEMNWSNLCLYDADPNCLGCDNPVLVINDRILVPGIPWRLHRIEIKVRSFNCPFFCRGFFHQFPLWENQQGFRRRSPYWRLRYLVLHTFSWFYPLLGLVVMLVYLPIWSDVLGIVPVSFLEVWSTQAGIYICPVFQQQLWISSLASRSSG